MAFEDYLEPEIAVTAVVTAAICSPQARKIMRRGAVYGMAGVLVVGDALSSFTRSVGQGFEEAKTTRAQKMQAQQSSDTGKAARGIGTKEPTSDGSGG